MITPTTMSMKNPVRLGLMMFMVCVVSQVVHGEQKIRCIPEEREALLQFKAAIVDHFGMLSSWTTPHCCQWEGIRCSNLTDHILSLHLPGEIHVEFREFYGEVVSYKYMSGEIHKSLMELPQLQYLNLSFNYFPDNNGIPEFLGSLKNLKYLDLSSCRFVGRIPSQFGSLSHLKYLNLSRNSLNGSIPHQLGNLSQLQCLDLSYNNFEGNIPSQLGNLSQLHELYLRGGYGINLAHEGKWLSNLFSLTHLDLSSVSNPNPSHSWLKEIAKLPKLRELSLVDCSLSDHFILSSTPFKFNFSTSLSVLDLSHNTFTSPMVFQWVSNITSNLVELDLSYNFLKGSISSDFVMVMNSLRHLHLRYLRNIQLLDLSINYLFGKIPKCIKNFVAMAKKTSSEGYHHYNFDIGKLGGTNSYELNEILMWKGSKQMFMNEELSLLKSIDLSSNHFSKEIPMEIEDLFELVSLNLSRNNLIGKIPSNIGKLTSLEFLDLSRNQLVGSIPTSLAQINRLTMLDLSHNYLTGEIPIGTQLQSFNATSYENNLDLCGLPLEKLCIKPAQDKNVKIHHDEYSFLNNDFLISMAFGFVISFLMVFFSILFKRSWRHAYFKFLNKLADNIYVKVAVFC